MYAVRKGLSVVLLLLLVPLLSAQIALRAAQALLASPTAAKRAVRSSGFYTRAEEVLIASFTGELQDGSKQVTLDTETAREIVHAVLPAPRLEAMGDVTVDGLRLWLLGRTERPEIILDLTDIRKALPGALRPALEKQVAALPVCSPQQALQLARNPGKDLPPCRAADPKVNQAVIDRVLQSGAIAGQIPDRIDVAAQMETAGGPEFWEDANQSLRPVRRAFGLAPWGWAVVGCLLLLLWLLNREHWYSALGWAGIALVLGGTLSFLAAVVILRLMVPGVVPAQMANPAEIGVAALLQALLTAIGTSLRNLSLMVLLAGVAFIALLVYGVFARNRSSQRPGAPA